MEEQRARQIVRHAVALRVLVPEDLAATGKAADDPIGLLIELERRSLLSPEVVDALGELVDAQAPARRKKAKRPARLLIGAGGAAGESDSDTLAPEREGGSDTLAPERDDEPFRPPGGLKDELEAAASFLVDQEPGTLSPERDDADPALRTGGATAGGTLEGGTAGGTLSEDLPARPGATLGGTLPGDVADLASGAGTVVGSEEGAVHGGEGTIGGVPAPGVRDLLAGSGRTVKRALDLGLVSDQVRRRIEEAALARAVIRSGRAPVKQVLGALKAARERKVLFQEHLLQEGLLDAAALRAISRDIQSIQRVCGGCLQPLPPEAPLDAACPGCGHVTSAGGDDDGSGTGADTGGSTAGDTAGGDASSTGEGTIASSTGVTASTASGHDDQPRGSSKGIEGFPGEGGTFANYELIKRVAEGGMGVVFKAREQTLNRIVALKVMRGGALASKVRRRRFLAEAESAAGLHHPSIVPIHQISEVAGYPFYTMDFVDGRPLDEWVKRAGAGQEQVARLMRAVADAVHHFHLRGIIHRDLKPDNILVTEEGEPKVIDFGIAKKITSEFDTEASWTVEGEVLGTPHYMPPEQAAGRVQEVDTRSDVYALGAIIYKLLTGKPPFAGLPVARVVLAIQDDDPAKLTSVDAGIDRDLEAIVEKAMAKERERRYQSALELAQDLDRFLAQEPIQARPASLGYRARKFVRRYRAAVTAAAAVALLLLGFVAVQVEGARREAELVARMLEDGRAAPLEKRPEMFARVLERDPENELARAEKEKAESQLESEAEARRARDEARLAEARAELMQAEERARQEAERRSREEALERAKELLVRAEGTAEPLDQVGLVGDALVLVPERSGELGGRLAARKVDLCLRLADEALAQHQGGLAAYWLSEARKLEAAAPRAGDVARIASGIELQRSGLALLDEARALIRSERWLLARDKLAQARAHGVGAELIQEDLALVQLRCAAEARRLLDQGRGFLQEGRPEQGLAAARGALDHLEERDRAPALELIESCAQRAAQEARLQAHRLSLRPEGRGEALALLQRAARTVEGTSQAALLERERLDRARLVEQERELAMLVYVPAVGELDLAPFYALRTEVTNQEYKAFVEAGGYADRTLWDEEALPALAGFLDGTPGEGARPGPRTWRQGSYGDEANALRPVTGVTWWEARAYARWRSRVTGRTWRLPGAAEWEAAAGWDPETRRLAAYPWGDAFDAGRLVCGATTAARVGTTPEDRSPLGLLDPAGNASEWVELGQPARPGLKGASFAVPPPVARHLAQVRTLGRPEPAPPPELLGSIGFRLVVDP